VRGVCDACPQRRPDAELVATTVSEASPDAGDDAHGDVDIKGMQHYVQTSLIGDVENVYELIIDSVKFAA